MEYGSIERELHVEATPEVVYQVISRPEHLREWWPDEAELEPVPGGTGLLTFDGRSTPEAKVAPLTVVEADPPRRFSFRWVYEGEVATAADSLLVTFELTASEGGTLVRFTETGFREKGWEAAVLEEAYQQHVDGWSLFLPRLVEYAARVASR